MNAILKYVLSSLLGTVPRNPPPPPSAVDDDDTGVDYYMSRVSPRNVVRELCFDHGWVLYSSNEKNVGHATEPDIPAPTADIDVYLLELRADDHRYLYVAYHDFGIEPALTRLVAPAYGSIVGMTDPRLAMPLIEEWVSYYGLIDEDNFLASLDGEEIRELMGDPESDDADVI